MEKSRKKLPPNIKTASDLVTSHNDICQGFLEQALAKSAKAVPYIKRARELQKTLQVCTAWTVARAPVVKQENVVAESVKHPGLGKRRALGAVAVA